MYGLHKYNAYCQRSFFGFDNPDGHIQLENNIPTCGITFWHKSEGPYFQDANMTIPCMRTDDPVGAVWDSSGNGLHRIQKTASRRPKFKPDYMGAGLHAVVHDGSDDSMTIFAANRQETGGQHSISISKNIHLYMVLKNPSASSGFWIAQDDNIAGGFYFWAGGGSVIDLYDNNGVQLSYNNSSWGYNISSFTLIELHLNDNIGYCAYKGDTKYNFAPAASLRNSSRLVPYDVGIPTARAFWIGSRKESGFYSTTEYAEILMYDNQYQLPEERRIIREYFKNRFSLSITP